MKYLPVNVYRSDLGDCTNGGVTADDGKRHREDEPAVEHISESDNEELEWYTTVERSVADKIREAGPARECISESAKPEWVASKLFVVPCEDGFLTDEGLADRSNVVILEPAEIMGSLYFKPSTIKGHSMAGGNFVYSSDSRFGRTYSRQPVRVHDRVE